MVNAAGNLLWQNQDTGERTGKIIYLHPKIEEEERE